MKKLSVEIRDQKVSNEFEDLCIVIIRASRRAILATRSTSGMSQAEYDGKIVAMDFAQYGWDAECRPLKMPAKTFRAFVKDNRSLIETIIEKGTGEGIEGAYDLHVACSELNHLV